MSLTAAANKNTQTSTGNNREKEANLYKWKHETPTSKTKGKDYSSLPCLEKYEGHHQSSARHMKEGLVYIKISMAIRNKTCQ